MPWVREQVAPYCYEDVYKPSTTEKFWYSTRERTGSEMDEIYERVNKRPPSRPHRNPRNP